MVNGLVSNTYGYDTDRERIEKISNVGGKISNTFYLGNAFERVISDTGLVSHKYYIGAGAATVVLTQRSNSVNDTRYLHKDHIGSIDAVTDENGAIKELNSFGAWGERRSANWVEPIANLVASFSTRGFTGHEMEDDVGLINMNARLYDPVTGRFLQADTVIQFPDSTQGFNRYTYVENNPLSYTDPTGHGLLRSIVNKVVGGASRLGEGIINAYKDAWNSIKNELKRFFLNNAWAVQLTTIAIGSLGGGPVGVALFQGYITHISGGTWTEVGTAMAISWASAYAYGEVESLKGFSAVMANGTIGGLTSMAQGGKFGDGFRSAAVGKLVTIGTKGLGVTSKVGQFVATTLSGGLAAEAGGGKFADGAETAAMGYIFQEGVRGNLSLTDIATGVLDVVGKFWSLPNTIIGLAYGGVGYMAGLIMGTNPSINFGNNAIQFENNPLTISGTAITLGNTISYGQGVGPSTYDSYGDPSVQVGRHEQAHTYQYQVLGPLFLPAYFLSGGIAGPGGNSFESAAQDYGRGTGGWW